MPAADARHATRPHRAHPARAQCTSCAPRTCCADGSGHARPACGRAPTATSAPSGAPGAPPASPKPPSGAPAAAASSACRAWLPARAQNSCAPRASAASGCGWYAPPPYSSASRHGSALPVSPPDDPATPAGRGCKASPQPPRHAAQNPSHTGPPTLQSPPDDPGLPDHAVPATPWHPRRLTDACQDQDTLRGGAHQLARA